MQLHGAKSVVCIPAKVNVLLRWAEGGTFIEALCTGIVEGPPRKPASDKNKGGRPFAVKYVETPTLAFRLPLCGLSFAFEDGVAWCVEQYVLGIRRVNKDIEGKLDWHINALLQGTEMTVSGVESGVNAYTYTVQLQKRTTLRSFVYVTM